MLAGIDVSRHQGNVEWPAVAAAGYRFAFVKATEGATWTDPLFSRNWDGARAAGLRVGAYHYARPEADDWAAEAEHFARTVGALAGALPPVLDLEDGDGDLTGWCLAWLGRVERLTGRRPAVYSYPAFWRAHVRPAAELRAHPLWVARYGPHPEVFAPWDDWTFWQHTSDGAVPGVAGRCDLDRFNGGEAELAALCEAPMEYRKIVDWLARAGVAHRTTSTYRPGDPGRHGRGLAADFAGPTPSRDSSALRAIFDAFRPVEGLLHELIYADAPYNIRAGRRVAPYAVDSHHDHVHVSIDPGTVLAPPTTDDEEHQEMEAQFVLGLYAGYFAVRPGDAKWDPQGFDYWLKSLLEGVPRNTVRAAFARAAKVS